MSQKVAFVKSLCFSIEKGDAASLSVHAIGSVSSSGWRNGVLSPVEYVVQPADGIQDVDFLADAPAGKVLWVMSPISGEVQMNLAPWMKGVRVHAASNSMVVMLDQAACAVGQGTLADVQRD